MDKQEAIIAVLPGDRLGGAEQYLKNISREFSRRGYQAHVIFLTRRRFGDWDGIDENIRFYFSGAGSEKWGLPHLVRTIRRISGRYRVKFTFSSNTHINSFLGLLRPAGILKTGKLVVRESTTILTRFSGFKRFLFVMHYRMGYRFTDLVICQTGRMRDELWKYMPPSRNWNVRVIGNPVDLEQIEELASEPAPAAIDRAGRFVVGAGRLIKIKGFDILIEAFGVLAREHPGLKLVILGEGEERVRLERLADRLGLGGRVMLPGRVDNPVIWFREARLCVVSSLVEGFPNVLLQMMSQCERVVSTTCAGDIDRIEGVLTCPPGDSSALALQMKNALETGESAGTRKMFDKFLKNNTVEKFADRIIELS